jgi:predicted short-subunit dehydrogenase-like oxidoreductase (DUF2520 family)
MLPGMVAKPRIAIVGAGNFGSALAQSLRHAGYAIEAVVARAPRKSSRESGCDESLRRESLKRAQSLAGLVGGRVVTDLQDVRAEVIWFCVPDSAIAGAAKSLAGKFESKGRVALHSSGALSSSELSALRKRGAAVASVHPLMTFVRGAYLSRSQNALRGVPFAIEGDTRAVREARRIVRNLGGHAYTIDKKDKAAYHAWGTFASPLLTALLATTEQVAALAGVNQKGARQRMIPILQQTLENYAAFGAADGFSEPIVRGDVDTVKRHLRVLRGTPAAEVYVALARAALRYLPAKNKSPLKRILDSSRGDAKD